MTRNEPARHEALSRDPLNGKRRWMTIPTSPRPFAPVAPRWYLDLQTQIEQS
jgi:hypothetical protein